MGLTPILVVAGDASGDLYGAQLLKSIRKMKKEVSFFGIGGNQMVEEGLELIVHLKELSVVGLWEALTKVPLAIKAWLKLKKALEERKPPLAILIDFPGFNLSIAPRLKKRGVKVLYYVSPQLWAWWPSRAKRLKESVDALAVVLPFEESFFNRYGIKAHFVGHPQWEVLERAPHRTEARRTLGLREDEVVIGFFPGSRKGEFLRHLDLMGETLELLRETLPSLRPLLALAPGLEELRPMARAKGFEVLYDKAIEVLSASDLAIAASGTITLQAALLGVPMVVVYKVHFLSYFLGKRLVKVPYISLPNLLLGEQVVPELVQKEANPQRIAEEALRLLRDHTYREQALGGFQKLRGLLPKGASERVAKMALGLLEAGT